MWVRVGQIVGVGREVSGAVRVPRRDAAAVVVVGWQGTIGRGVALAGHVGSGVATVRWWVGRIGGRTGVIVGWNVVKWELGSGGWL